MPRSAKSVFLLAGTALLILLVFFLHAMRISAYSELTQLAITSLHAPGFGALALLLLLALRKWMIPSAAYLLAAVTVAAFGVTTEAIQILGPRNAQVTDLIQNVIGILGFLSAAAAFDVKIREHLSRAQSAILILAAVVFGTAAFLPLLNNLSSVVWRQQAMPQILGFDSRWERRIFLPQRPPAFERIAAPADWPVKEGSVAILRADPESRYLLRFEPFPDWRGYAAFSFLAASLDGKTVTATLSVRDLHTRRPTPGNSFYQKITIGPAAIRYRISLQAIADGPADRDLDLSRISSVVLTKPENAGSTVIMVDDFRLEKN